MLSLTGSGSELSLPEPALVPELVSCLLLVDADPAPFAPLFPVPPEQALIMIMTLSRNAMMVGRRKRFVILSTPLIDVTPL